MLRKEPCIEQKRMRGHLLKCFEEGALTPFPTSTSKSLLATIAQGYFNNRGLLSLEDAFAIQLSDGQV